MKRPLCQEDTHFHFYLLVTLQWSHSVSSFTSQLPQAIPLNMPMSSQRYLPKTCSPKHTHVRRGCSKKPEPPLLHLQGVLCSQSNQACTATRNRSCQLTRLARITASGQREDSNEPPYKLISSKTHFQEVRQRCLAMRLHRLSTASQFSPSHVAFGNRGCS